MISIDDDNLIISIKDSARSGKIVSQAWHKLRVLRATTNKFHCVPGTRGLAIASSGNARCMRV